MIPRSRRMAVDGHELRWSMPTRRPRPLRISEEGPLTNSATLTVQHASGRGGVAQAVIVWTHGTAVTPEVVSIVVRRMLAAGWRPGEKGPPFLIDSLNVEDLGTRESVLRDVMGS